MTQTLGHVVAILAELVDLADAEAWDNVGLLVGDSAAPIAAVFITNDWDERVAAEALSLYGEGKKAARQGSLAGVLVVAYHPPWFKPLRRLTAPSPLFTLVHEQGALYSVHTALDAGAHGANAALAARLELVHPMPLGDARPGQPADRGPGRVGSLAQATPLAAFVGRVKAAVGTEQLLVAASAPSLAEAPPVQRVAVAAGSGRSLVERARAAGADVLVTGELTHHDAIFARGLGLTVVVLRHSVSERFALGALAKSLQSRIPGISVRQSARDCDPFHFV